MKSNSVTVANALQNQLWNERRHVEFTWASRTSLHIHSVAQMSKQFYFEQFATNTDELVQRSFVYEESLKVSINGTSQIVE